MSQIVTKKIDAPILIHPEVVFSVWDHIKRSNSEEQLVDHRIVGALMGYYKDNIVEITSSFAIPYDEYKENNSIWYVDADYVKLFSDKLNKLDPNNHLIGWYHNGDQIVPGDVQIHGAFSDMIDVPVLILFDFNKKDSLPIKGYLAAEKVRSDGTKATRGFDYLRCEYVYDSAEEMSIVQLKRFIPKDNVGLLTRFMKSQFDSMHQLTMSLENVIRYLTMITQSSLPINNQILYQVQSLVNQIFVVSHNDITRIANLHHNDNLVATYMAVICKNVTLLNDLLNNRLLNAKKLESGANKFFDGGKNVSSTTTTTTTAAAVEPKTN